MPVEITVVSLIPSFGFHGHILTSLTSLQVEWLSSSSRGASSKAFLDVSVDTACLSTTDLASFLRVLRAVATVSAEPSFDSTDPEFVPQT